mmetsp:Transcript_1492/g.1700  ORF Transcript_1492/g.1700 Transcript_1492/m.1700 type:complete len:150 (-) Transcript_1492:284-733(-)|eukprot:CAMPEP_0197848502 /NCGR_PEP_ID=MMETSP1438-20131217/8925_1 /TAXON_ID=1461541 /ORGANISM="Pterosperma sp., Strain CCMP1384" /LENGTH=149 /DNA_ID=CAMNT_0043460779 /DNA_START=116 /DNA_END=565 /DNA_ORIENTATION=-
MTAMQRVGYLDTNMSEFLKESYNKEEKVRDEFFTKTEAERAAAGIADMPAHSKPADVKYVKPPPMTTGEVQGKMGVELSKNLWRRCNPGYNVGSATFQSTTKSDYVYDADEVLEANGDNLNKALNRKRDDFTHYVEASSRHKLLSKSKN